MNDHSPSRSKDAFTLIEMVLAIGVMAIVMVAINSVFFTALRLRDRTADTVDQSQPAQQALTFLRRDLLNAMAPGGLLSGDFRVGNVSEPNMSENAAIELYTTTGALSETQPWADIQKVTYELKTPTTSDALGGKDLVRTVTRNLLSTATPEASDQWLLGSVQNLQFECFDGTQWLDNWDTTAGNTNLPVAVRVRIELAEGNDAASGQQPIELLVPVASQSATNQLQAATSTGN